MSRSLEPQVFEGVPVFPLPEYVLFPHTLIPFHIFEPRYRQLVSDVLAGQRLIVVAGLQAGWESDYFASPPVHAVAGLGKVVNEERLEDGRFNIFVHCLHRVRILETTQMSPYRIARVEEIPDFAAGYDAALLTEAVGRLRACVLGLAGSLPEEAPSLGKVLTSTDDAAVLTNRLAALMVTDAGARQALLEERCPLKRAERLTALIAERMFEGVGQAPDDADPGQGWMN